MKSRLSPSSSARHKLLNVRLDAETRERFRRTAKKTGKKESELLRELILLAIEGMPVAPASHLHHATEKHEAGRMRRATVWMPGLVLKTARSRAKTQGMALSRWIAALVQSNLLKIPVLATEELSALKDCNYELNALGRNLNQIARVINADDSRTDLMTRQMILALHSSISETQQTIQALVRAGNNIWSVDDV